MPKDETLRQSCASCNGITNHRVLGENKDTGNDEEYHCLVVHRIVQCLGCDLVSFRYEFHDYENSYPTSDGERDYDMSVECYPAFIEGHQGILHTYRLPHIVQKIYKETLDAIKSGSCTLAGIGLRATVEAICNEQKLKGSNLVARINKLAKDGTISKKDAERLHAIRFMGNDAAHEIKPAKKEAVLVALSIIEYLLQSLYLLDSDVASHFEMPISTYDDFISLINNLIEVTPPSHKFTLFGLLGVHRRRILVPIDSLETQLLAQIDSGIYARIKKVGTIKGGDGKEKPAYQTNIDQESPGCDSLKTETQG